MKTLPKEATSIHFQAQPGKAQALADFLAEGAALVQSTEPETLQWVAQREGENDFRIVDFFANEAGRAAHFAGQVAAALQSQAGELVASGWEEGVVANIENSTVLASVVRDSEATTSPTLATSIRVTANNGQEEQLAEFLTGGARIVNETEPGTLLWYAIRVDHATFIIYDVFADEAARAAHFDGKVAAALQESAATLIEGGWEKGVVSNVIHSNIQSITF